MPAITHSEFNGILVCNQFEKSRRCAPCISHISPSQSFYYFAEIVYSTCSRHYAWESPERVGTKFKCLQDVGTDPLARRQANHWLRSLYFINGICSNKLAARQEQYTTELKWTWQLWCKIWNTLFGIFNIEWYSLLKSRNMIFLFAYLITSFFLCQTQIDEKLC